MLPKQHRLPLRFARKQLEEKATTYHTPLFTALIAPSSLGPSFPIRFSLIISKKIHPHAIPRNTAKRRLLGALLPLLPSLKPGFDVLFFAKKPLIDSDSRTISTHLRDVLIKVDIIKE